MSYILDALKRAESERSRGEIPGLNAQPMGLSSADTPAPASRPMVAAMAAGIAVGVCGLLWWWFGSGGAPAASDSVPAPAVSPVQAPMAAPPAAVLPQPVVVSGPEVSPAAPAVVVEAVRPAASPVSREPVHTAPVTLKAPPRDAANASSRSKSAAPRPAPSASGGSGLPQPAVGDADSRVYTLNELPADIRGALPTLAVGGASHSEHAASRMLILNGQIYHEGDRLTAELTLQQIQLRSAVLSFRGYRFAINY